MRWREPNFGDERVIKRFLLIPRTVDGETRWLEWAFIRQKYVVVAWSDKEWVDKRPIQKPTGGSGVSVNPTNKPFPGPQPKQFKR